MSAPDVQLGPVASRLPEALLLLEANGAVLDANSAACALFGVSVGELRTRRLMDLVCDGERELARYLRQCAGSGQPVVGAVALDLGGERVVFRCEGAVVRPASGGHVASVYVRLRPRSSVGSRFQLLSTKVDELEREVGFRRRAEGLLDGQRRVLESVAEGAPLKDTLSALVEVTEAHSSGGQRASILLLDEAGRCLRHGAGNRLPPAYCEAIDGVEIGPAVGSCGTAAYENRPVMVADIATDPLWADYRDLALSHGLRACWSTPITARDGSVLGTFALYYDEPQLPSAEDRQVVEIMTRVASIAIERKRSEDEIRRLLESERTARSEAESANRSKDEFLALVSHELRNPLNAILGWVQLLQTGSLDEAAFQKAIETIERNARLQDELIGDVLDFARVTSGRMTLDIEPASLRAVVEKPCESVGPEASARGLSLTLDLEVSDQPVALDANRLQQAVSNVLWNAIKFTPRGGRILVAATRDGDLARIKISDTGCGIEPEFLPYVFERFRQADAGVARRHGGLGLGLAIVRHIVELHGGSVEATSGGPGTGATFTLTIPVSPLVAGTQIEDVARVAAASLVGCRVLAVEDVADERELLSAALRYSGAKVTMAASAQEAIDFLERERPDVIVCDIGMPGTDGYEFMRRWRAIEGDGRLPAVALTAYGRQVDRQRALDAGFDRHVAKPFDVAALVKTVAELSARGRTERTDTTRGVARSPDTRQMHGRRRSQRA